MPQASPDRPAVVRFGPFELDLRAGELSSGGVRTRLQGHSLEILNCLLERPGELVTRDDLRGRLWPDGTFVDFEHGVNTALARLREALGDDADSPHLIETVPRRGYRFIAPVTIVHALHARPAPEVIEEEPRQIQSPPNRRVAWAWTAVVAMAMVAAGALVALNVGGVRDRLTGRRPAVTAAPLIVAVMPFRSVAANPEYAYLADGATEALINGLSGMRDAGVMASASARKAAASGADTPEFATRLNADRVIEGTSFGDRALVRFEVRVCDRRGLVLWAGRAEGQPDEILAVQGDLVAKVSGALGRDLPLERRARVARIDPSAHAILVKGLVNAPPNDARRIAEVANQALALAPAYADAHLLAAHSLALSVYYGDPAVPPEAALRQAREHADRAAALSPGLGLVYRARATVRFVAGDPAGAEQDFERALALMPGSAETQKSWSWYLSHWGRYDECLAAAQLAERLDPMVPSTTSGWCLFKAGRYAESAAALETTSVGRGGRPIALLAAAYARAGRVAEAKAVRDQVRKMVPAGQSPPVDWWLQYVHLAEGDRAGAERVADLWWAKPDKSVMLWMFVAQMYCALDDADRVVESVTRGVEQSGPSDPIAGGPACLAQVLRAPGLLSERLRSDPRILALIRRLEAATPR